VRINDPSAVARQYATEANLEARRSLYATAEGPDPRDLAFEAVAECNPKRVLEVGGGPGELAARIGDELGCEMVMVDVSPRMVELAQGAASTRASVTPRACRLRPGQLSRVLVPGGRLVAVTNSERHMAELRSIAGSAAWARVFTRENGTEILGRRFASVERRDADGWVTIDDDALVRGFVASLDADERPELGAYDLPLRCRRASSVFVATKAL
jgi:protein-L-isoaspartate O-methyltransferase